MLTKTALSEALLQRTVKPAWRAYMEAPSKTPRSDRMRDLLAGVAIRRAKIPKAYQPESLEKGAQAGGAALLGGLIDGLEKLGLFGAGVPIWEGKGEHIRPYLSLGLPYIVSAGLKHTSNLPVGDEYGIHPAIGVGLTGPHIAAIVGKRKDHKKKGRK